VGVARIVMRDATGTLAGDVQKLLPIGYALAVHRYSTGGQRMTARLHQAARRPSVNPSIFSEVLSGLRGSPKTLPPKLFYDELGACLFELICEQPEYYLTRAELSILERHAGGIAELIGPDAALVEYGSGAGVKVRLLLDAMDHPVAYTPIDISHAQLAHVAASLGRDYPDLAVRPLCADYMERLELPALPAQTKRRIAFFPGSTIGNLHPAQAIGFLQRVRHVVAPGGGLVLGVDRRKDRATLDAAYNDAAGVTARFNINMLAHLNREVEADFHLNRFRHVAFFNEEASRIEMHLESLVTQDVSLAGERIPFVAGETIWTESSYKYDEESLRAVASAAGFQVREQWTDEDERFWVVYLEP
jgi:dimethylhistidine N-methyltransferase